MIKSIDTESIHRICSSQVIVDLGSALKELVENSLDAGATSIEIKLRNMGADLIEVSDNAKGIDPVDYDSIAQKHHTSKLRDFEDLEGISSFGFRGEALNALCELSKGFTICTKRAEDSTGKLLKFDKFGRLASQSVFARGNGTTVTVENLFENLPVRRMDYVKNIKKQYQKALKLIQAYALFSVGVRISMTNISDTGRQIALTTPQSTKIEDNISIIFGSKFLDTLLSFKFSLTEEDINAKVIEIDNDDSEVVDEQVKSTDTQPSSDQVSKPSSGNQFSAQINGWISKVGEGVGRSDNERQYTFLNGRPVDVPKIAKALNECWRRYEMKQKPAFIIDLKVSKGYFDVNITPDKREVIIRYESQIIEKLKTIVDELYAPSRGSFQINNHHLSASKFESFLMSGQKDLNQVESSQSSNSNPEVDRLATQLPTASPTVLSQPSSSQTEIDKSTSSINVVQSFDKATGNVPAIERFSQSSLSDEHEKNAIISTSPPIPSSDKTITWSTPLENERYPLLKVGTSSAKSNNSPAVSSSISSSQLQSRPLTHFKGFSPLTVAPKAPFSIINLEAAGGNDNSPHIFNKELEVDLQGFNSSVRNNDTLIRSQDSDIAPKQMKISTLVVDLVDTPDDIEFVEDKIDEELSVPQDNELMDNIQKAAELTPMETVSDSGGKTSILKVNVAEIERNFEKYASQYYAYHSEGVSSGSDLAGSITEEVSNNLINDGYKRLSKTDFTSMRIIGQFNLGFIITEFDGDLYILDQHACDEKYRFEMLQRATKINTQQLLIPTTLETSAANESVIEENLHVFESNGFRLIVDKEAPTGKRIKIAGLPVYKGIQFSTDDINELASVIADGHDGSVLESRVSKEYLMIQNETLHPKSSIIMPKLMSTYASKACRTAVMIGTGLKRKEMENIVSQLSEIDQPWNCPHGRPTLRHLFDLRELQPQKRLKSHHFDKNDTNQDHSS